MGLVKFVALGLIWWNHHTNENLHLLFLIFVEVNWKRSIVGDQDFPISVVWFYQGYYTQRENRRQRSRSSLIFTGNGPIWWEEMTRKMVNVTRKSGPHHHAIAGAIMKSHHVIDGVLVIKDKKSLEGYLNFWFRASGANKWAGCLH